MDGNYIKIYRSFMDWEWYSDINTCRLFLHMLLKANWKDGKFQGTTVPRGSFVSSIDKLSEETKLTKDEVRTAIKHLICTEEITKQSTNKFTVFTIKNYTQYQDNTNQEHNQLPSNPQPIPTLFPTIEEGKKERREDNKEVPDGTKKPASVNFGKDSFEISCVDILIKSCLEAIPSSKVPDSLDDKQKWAVEIDRMKRIDKQNEQDILKALYFAINDSFWKSNIRSTKKFREKFETLFIQAGQASSRQSKKPNQFNNFPQRDYTKSEISDLEKRLLQRRA